MHDGPFVALAPPQTKAVNIAGVSLFLALSRKAILRRKLITTVNLLVLPSGQIVADWLVASKF